MKNFMEGDKIKYLWSENWKGELILKAIPWDLCFLFTLAYLCSMTVLIHYRGWSYSHLLGQNKASGSTLLASFYPRFSPIGPMSSTVVSVSRKNQDITL